MAIRLMKWLVKHEILFKAQNQWVFFGNGLLFPLLVLFYSDKYEKTMLIGNKVYDYLLIQKKYMIRELIVWNEESWLM